MWEFALPGMVPPDKHAGYLPMKLLLNKNDLK
jgi:hypothetical protein